MKKNFKLVLALVLSIMMVLGSMSALADVDKSAATTTVNIKVTGIYSGDTLHLYKLGTPTIGDDNQMTIAWTNDAIYTALKDLTTDGYTFTYNSDMQAAVAKLIAEGKINMSGDGDYKVAATGTEVDVDVAPGYYFGIVRQGDGSKAALVIYQNMIFNVIPEPNDAGVWVPHLDIEAAVKKSEESLTKKQKENGGSDYVTATVEGYKRGDVIPFQITTNMPTYPTNAKVATFKIGDTANGVKLLNTDTYPVTVKVAGTAVAPADDKFTLTVNDSKMQIVFKKDYILSNANAAIEVTYSGELISLTTNAVDETTNKATITYNLNPDEEGTYEPETEIKEKTYSFTLLKHEEGDTTKALKGAHFSLWTAATGGEMISLIKEGDVYRPIKDGETGTTDIVVDDDGTATIVNLAKTTYYLQEDIAPAGYTKLANRQAAAADENTSAVGIDHKVPNTKGATLPETGGVGTTIFYVGGSIMVLAAAILLITKRRMGNND